MWGSILGFFFLEIPILRIVKYVGVYFGVLLFGNPYTKDRNMWGSTLGQEGQFQCYS